MEYSKDKYLVYSAMTSYYILLIQKTELLLITASSIGRLKFIWKKVSYFRNGHNNVVVKVS